MAASCLPEAASLACVSSFWLSLGKSDAETGLCCVCRSGLKNVQRGLEGFAIHQFQYGQQFILEAFLFLNLWINLISGRP